MTLFPGHGTDMHFTGDETGLQWEDYLFEMRSRRAIPGARYGSVAQYVRRHDEQGAH